MSNAYHFMGFIMHQPAGNLLHLMEQGDEERWHLQQIMLAYQRPLKYAERFRDVGRFCVCFSGILLEQLQDPELVERYPGFYEDLVRRRGYSEFVNIPGMLDGYRNAQNIEIAGTGYYHPLFPLIPEADWDEHIERGRDKVIEVFRRTLEIFWPPELGFTGRLIPHLVTHGYRYAICDGVHIRPHQALTPGETIYRPHLSTHDGKTITLIPRDGQLSLAQKNGEGFDWFDPEVRRKTAGIGGHSLVTTWTDGENGDWFRRLDESEGFWGHFFEPYMEKVKTDETVIRPTSLVEFVKPYPPSSKVQTQTGTWAYEDHDDYSNNEKKILMYNFHKWVHLPEQQEALNAIHRVSDAFHAIRRKFSLPNSSTVRDSLQSAENLILKAEASDNLAWETAWLDRCYADLDAANAILDQIRNMLP
jgi:hypothetical protein